MTSTQPDYDRQTDYDRRLRGRYTLATLYFATFAAAWILTYLGVRGNPPLLTLALTFYAANMGIVALAIVNLFRLPFFHTPGKAPPLERGRVFILRMWAIIYAFPLFLSMGGLVWILFGPNWVSIPIWACVVLAIIIIGVMIRSPTGPTPAQSTGTGIDIGERP